jgi:hypothetical protein
MPGGRARAQGGDGPTPAGQLDGYLPGPFQADAYAQPPVARLLEEAAAQPARPLVVRAQNQSDLTYAPPDHTLPLPLFSTRPESGFFTALSLIYYRQTNPLKDQTVAVRGFLDVDGSVTRAINGFPQPNPSVANFAGTFQGSATPAANVMDVSGPNSYEPGFVVDIGWKFRDGHALVFTWMYLNEHRVQSATTGIPLDQRVGGPQGTFADALLFSNVFNFPPEFAGPDMKVNVGNPQALHGIWNGASYLTQEFIQRVQKYELTWRFPVYETETFRFTGLTGPRFFWIWERYKWVDTSLDINDPTPNPGNQAIYTNIVSNRMYGATLGFSQECYLGGGLALQLDMRGALYLDYVKERAKYELATKFTGPASKQAKTDWTLAPEIEGMIGLMWYPREGIQLYLGYDAMAFFNTVASPRPIDLNWGFPHPEYDRVFRLFDGLRAGISLDF